MTSPLSGLRVLVIEDEILVSWLLEDMLSELGCVVAGPAARIEQALEIVTTEAIDAAVLDVNLNGRTSYPVADALTARGVPFVFSTGYDKNSLAEGYRVFPVIQKPFHRSELAEALQGLLPQATGAETGTSDPAVPLDAG